MEENKGVPMSEWEWEGVVNSLRHKEEGDRREAERKIAAEAKANANSKEKEMFAHFHEERAQHRLERIQIDAARYGVAAVLAGVLAYITGTNGISWLAWLLGIVGGVLAIVSSFGFGIARGIGK